MIKKKQERIFEAILENRLCTLPWREFKELVRRLGAELKQGEGSRLLVVFPNGARAIFHKPHPGNELQVKDIKKLRRLLLKAGILCPA